MITFSQDSNYKQIYLKIYCADTNARGSNKFTNFNYERKKNIHLRCILEERLYLQNLYWQINYKKKILPIKNLVEFTKYLKF